MISREGAKGEKDEKSDKDEKGDNTENGENDEEVQTGNMKRKPILLQRRNRCEY